MTLDSLRQLFRALAPVLYAHAQYQLGFREGFALGRAVRRRFLSQPTIRHRCPHCGELDHWDRETLGILSMVAENQEHRRHLWLAHTAGIHGHPHPCVGCSAPAVRGGTLCCDCQAERAGVA